MISIDTSVKKGPILPVHGVCNGPLSWGGCTNLTRSYKAAGFPYARLHDPDYPTGPYVDIHAVFPDFDKDENDPDSYSFENTDDYIKAIIDCGTQIIYRLGPSIEHMRRKLYVHVPTDMEKWARVCVHIIRHYNEGWANGFHWNIRFWEVWNEVDLFQTDMWDGTPEDYFRLYTVTAKTIKKECPDVSVGGPALAMVINKDYIQDFLDWVKRENAPLDFFSWHHYQSDMDKFRDDIMGIREALDRNGFTDTLSVCDEWNMCDEDGFQLSNDTEQNENAKVNYFHTMTTEVGQAHTAAAMITYQQCGLDIATYYDAMPTNLWCGIFDRYGVPTKAYESFVAFNALYRLGGSEVQTICEDKNTYALAAEKDGVIRILIARYCGNAGFTELQINGAEPVKIFLPKNGILYREERV